MDPPQPQQIPSADRSSLSASAKLFMFVGLLTIVNCGLGIYTAFNEFFIFYWMGFVLTALIFIIFTISWPSVYRESPYFTWSIISLLAAFLFVQIAVLSVVYARDFVKFNSDKFEELWKRELKNPGPMADIEEEYACCGQDSFVDYKSKNIEPPNSCYPNEDSHNPLYTDGCLNKVKADAANAEDTTKLLSWIMNVVEAIILILFFVKEYRFRDYTMLA